MKKRSFILHDVVDNAEIALTTDSFNFAYANIGENTSIVDIMGDKFTVKESPREISTLIDELED